MTAGAARQRVLALVRAARRVADGSDPLGQRARAALVRSTGLSAAGVELALGRCLETRPSEDDLTRLCGTAPSAPRAHVLLSANVFVAAHRAIAIALAASEQVFVRPSRREPTFVELLAEAAPDSFAIVPELSPRAGDHVFAYGSDETLRQLRANLARGTVLHAHGSGFGVAVIDPRGRDPAERDRLCRALAEDVAAFDQRGCLSPRLLLVEGEPGDALETARSLAQALGRIADEVPRGTLDSAEQAAIVRYRDSAAYAGEIFAAGPGFVSCDPAGALPPVLAPIGRNVHVSRLGDPRRTLAPLAPQIAAVGLEAGVDLAAAISAVLPAARRSPIGEMQRPHFDGPVDLRVDAKGEVLR